MQEEQEKQDRFTEALNERKKILLTHFSGEQNLYLTRLCIPLEHIQPISENGSDFYYFWDENADVGERIFGCPSSEIHYIESSEESFNPNDYIIPNRSNS
jgi:hypothetical protein